jgi:uncharacterized protein
MANNDLNRRNFLKASLISSAGAIFSSSILAHPLKRNNGIEDEPKPIIKRKLGKTGIELPIVSFGVMRADSPALVQAALKAGVVHFDTAHGYQRGRNEEMLGEVFKSLPRDSFVISTKIKPDSKENIKQQFNEMLDLSLKRLKLNYVDILYIHAVSSRDEALSSEWLEAIMNAKKSGKAKHIGMSTHQNEAEVIQAAIDSKIYEVVLTSINYKQDHYQELKKVIEKANQAGIGIIAMKTMAGGFLDRERTKPVNCKAALKFVLQDENITTAIPGITNFDQLNMNISVNTDLILTPDERKDLAIGDTHGSLYCQQCGNCIPNCSKKLPIPDIMRAYMYTYGYNDNQQAHSLLTSLELPENPCSDCSRCTVVCSKKFKVREKIIDVARLTKVPVEFLG